MFYDPDEYGEKPVFSAIYAFMRSFDHDRLGTNVGATQKQTVSQRTMMTWMRRSCKVRTTRLFRASSILKRIILPRQARDKHI